MVWLSTANVIKKKLNLLPEPDRNFLKNNIQTGDETKYDSIIYVVIKNTGKSMVSH